ncbi:caspase Dronc-like isoform X2 [Macrobrachium nipponense]|uniref:caspase Dronc-like isoform X2 n=1 Tax=Macrobrachium nipponense TaxID=159736 RepID=UPI0030C8325C
MGSSVATLEVAMSMIEAPACSCPEPVCGTLPDEFLQHIQQGNLTTIEEWLASEGDVNSATTAGHTLLSAACIYNQLELVQRLLKNPQLHLNTKHRIGTLSGLTPFCIAAYKGLQDIVLALLESPSSSTAECRLNVEATSSRGKSAIRLAAEKKHWDVVDSLAALNSSLPAEDSIIVTNLAKFANRFNVVKLLHMQKEDSSIPASERVYANDTSPRGLVLILNYKFEDQPKMERKGTEADVALLQEVFHGMDYVTEVHCDLSLSGTQQELANLCEQDRLKDFSCVVVVVLTHGENQNTFCTADLNPMTTDDLLSYFVPSRCPHLKGKPKIFLLQFCRGVYMANQVNMGQRAKSDLVRPRRDAFTDMLCIYAAQEGFESYRFEGNPQDPFIGTPFIQAFSRVLQTKGRIFLDDF